MSDETTNTETESKKADASGEHWLTRPATVRRLWIGSSLVLALTVVLQLVISIKGYFGVDGWFGFGAGFGFLSCVAMVLIAKGLGAALKRPEGYYDD
jgi:hypothetical protein